SEWTAMLDLIEPHLRKRKLDFVRLDGSVPQRQREELVYKFQNDAECRLFLTTNAGSSGLNLQAANTVINVDLPWNPAVLEQRIARAHRMGQKRPVSVYVLVTEMTIEDNLLGTLSAKRDLAIAALDPASRVPAVDTLRGADEIKARLEVLLGTKPDAPVARPPAPAQPTSGLAETGTAFLKAAVAMLGEVPGADDQAKRRALAGLLRQVADAL